MTRCDTLHSTSDTSNTMKNEEENTHDHSIPPPEEQRAIIEALEEDCESSHVYCVSRIWYRLWRTYIGLPERDSPTQRSPSEHSARCRASEECGCVVNAVNSKHVSPSVSPRRRKVCLLSERRPSSESIESKNFPIPIEMDLSNDDNNIYVDEKVWKCWVLWFGVDASHELDRRNSSSDDKDFEICILSPYCGLIENPIKTFDVCEEVGYIELQLRRIFRVSESRSTRLWMCEKARHARFKPLLARKQEIYNHERMDSNKNYILALEVGNLDGSWPTHVPGQPEESLSRYRDLCEGGPRGGSDVWDKELKETLDMVFNGISNELKETADGIVNTSKCITELKERDVERVRDELKDKSDQLGKKGKALDAKLVEVGEQEAGLEERIRKLESDKYKFGEERQRFAEELVRMHTINKIQETRIKLNVGGHVFVTSTFTLTKESDSMLAAMFSGRHSLKQEDDGSYFIDRDGTHFRHILNYLRDGLFRSGTLPSSETFLAELYAEAEYYQLNGLKKLLDMMTSSSSEVTSDDSPRGSSRGLVSEPASGQAVSQSKSSPSRRMPRKIMSQAAKSEKW